MLGAKHRGTSWLGVVVGVAFAAGCSSTEVQRSEWVLTEPAEGTTLQFAVFAGHSSCLDFDDIKVVRKDAGRVEIQAFVEYSGTDCTDDWVNETVTVELDEPLADRPLIGCADEAIDWRGWNLEPDADCAQTLDENV